MQKNSNVFRCRRRRSRKCSGDWIFFKIVVRRCPLHPELWLHERECSRLRTAGLAELWVCCRTLQESWMVDSSIHAGLPPSPAAMTTQLGFEDAAVLGFSIYKYCIPLLQKTNLSLTLLLFFIFISPCIVHLLLSSPILFSFTL